jgi:hypothetical protein
VPLLKRIQRTLAGLSLRIDELKIQRRLEAAPPVFIYQMGKVGSSSLKTSLAPSWPGLTLHAHNLMMETERASVRLLFETVISKRGPIFVISPVREPIGRNVSAFFQNFERDTGVNYHASTFSIEELIGIFLKKHNHAVPLTWFDTRLRPVFDIDVYDYQFPASGIQVINEKNVKLLVMQCELPNSAKESAVRSFLTLPRFKLSTSNVGSQKPYAETYHRFVERFVPPDWYMTEMYESRFFYHFYDAAQRSRWVKKWSQKLDRNPAVRTLPRGSSI